MVLFLIMLLKIVLVIVFREAFIGRVKTQPVSRSHFAKLSVFNPSFFNLPAIPNWKPTFR